MGQVRRLENMKKWSTFVVGILDMTPEGLGEMFEGFSAETNTRKMSARINGALSGGSCMRTPGSEDPHQHERKMKAQAG